MTSMTPHSADTIDMRESDHGDDEFEKMEAM